MKKIPTRTEQELQELGPYKLDEDFMARLAGCADGTSLELTREEKAFEESLRSVKPRGVSAAFGSALGELVKDTPFPVDEKIVLFHKSGVRKPEPRAPRLGRLVRSDFAAAAAVALLGAFAALLLTGRDLGEAQVVEEGSERPGSGSVPSQILRVDQGFAPASYQRKLRDTRDEGVLWRGKNQPHRILRFKYMDRVTLENEKGEAVQVEQPREEIVIIPEKLD